MQRSLLLVAVAAAALARDSLALDGSRTLVAPELSVGEARQVERPDPELMPGELALGVVDHAAVQT